MQGQRVLEHTMQVCCLVEWISSFSSCCSKVQNREGEEGFILVHGLNRQGLASRMTLVYCSGNLRQLAESQEAKKKKSQAETDPAYYLQVPPLWLCFLSARPHVQPVAHLGTKCSNTWAVEDNSLSNGNRDQSVWLLHFFFISTGQTCQQGEWTGQLFIGRRQCQFLGPGDPGPHKKL